MNYIRITNLVKELGGQRVLDNITLEFEGPGIYGLVGRNGSGKTMLLRAVCGFIRPTAGSVEVNGVLLDRHANTPEGLGVIIETPGFLPDYSAYKNLKSLAMVRQKIGKEEIKEAIRSVGLDPDSRKHVGKYSLGMKQRLGIAQALMEDPDILLLDEPMNGLDNKGVEDMRRLFMEQRDKGKLIVLASHSREDITLLCDVVYYLDHGQVIDSEFKRKQ